MEEYITLPDLDVLSENGWNYVNEVIPSFSFSQLVNEITRGENVFNPEKILETLMKIFAAEIYSALKICTVIIAVVMLGAVLENLHEAFERRSGNISSIACIALIIGLLVSLYSESCTYAKGVGDDMTNIMVALLPVMMTLLVGGGLALTGAVTHPVLYFMCNVFAAIFNKILIPLSVVYLVLSLSDMLSDCIELTKFRELIRKAYNFILGMTMTFFTGLLGISSFVTTPVDGLGAKGARFAISNMVPFVGRSISDAMGAVVSASLVMKNAVGVVGIILMLALCIIPIIKIGAIVLCLRLSAAVCEPVADKKTIQALTAAGDSLSMINAAIVSTAVLMIISVGIIVGIK